MLALSRPPGCRFCLADYRCGFRARAAGIGGRMSGHSLQVGSAQALAAWDPSLVERQREGCWKSPEMQGLNNRN